jgi:hypothetical protein
VKRSKFVLVLSLLMSLGTFLPTLAAEEGLDKAVDGSLVVTRVGGLGAGLVLGTPVACIKESIKSVKDLTSSAADQVGGHESGPRVLLVGLFTVPVGLAVGGVKGVYFGTKNALVHGFNEPFHPNSFSLGTLEE